MLVGGVKSSFIETQKLARGETKNPRAILAYRPETYILYCLFSLSRYGKVKMKPRTKRSQEFLNVIEC